MLPPTPDPAPSPALLVRNRDDETGRVALQTLRKRIAHPRMQSLVARFRAQADQYAEQPAVDIHTPLPGRPPGAAEQGIKDTTLYQHTWHRLTTLALAAMLWERPEHLRPAREQLTALFSAWPDWGLSESYPIELRAGSTALNVALSINWLWPYLTDAERAASITELRRRVLEPISITLTEKIYPYHRRNNWCWIVMAGAGLVAMLVDRIGSSPVTSLGLTAGDIADRCRERMLWVLDGFGANGEFNESPGYTDGFPNSFTFLHALQGEDPTADDRITARMHDLTVWTVYAVEPPGRYVNHGDSGGGQFRYWWLPAVAARTRDPVIQWFYERLAENADCPVYPIELIGYDPQLPAKPPTPDRGWPLGRAYRAHGGLVSSRSDWNMTRPHCVVFSKAGTEAVHEHNDAGQVLVQGNGDNLIVDAMQHGYPDDYWGPGRYGFPFAAARAHNILTFGNDVPEYHYPQTVNRGELVHAEFDDTGGWWSMDLSEPDRGIEYRRTVVHQHPGLVVVCDRAKWTGTGPIVLRWHLPHAITPDHQSRFRVEGPNGGTLEAAIHRLCGPQPILQPGGWPPTPETRQRNFPYIAAATDDSAVRFLSLFAVAPEAALSDAWHHHDQDGQTQHFTLATIRVTVTPTTLHLFLNNHSRSIPLP